jgi:hypothetical protein
MWRWCHEGEIMKLTKKEQQAIDMLKRLALIWPDTLWLFCGGLSVAIMKYGPNGEQMTLGEGGGMDPAYLVDTVDINNDGGDW